MVGFETGPMAAGRPNDPLPFNFLHVWVTASSKGEGKAAQETSKQMMQLHSALTVSKVVSRLPLCNGFNGKWC